MADVASLLHQKAAKVNPINDGKPTTIKVAILKAGRSSDEDLTTEDFLWVKCNAKIVLSKILHQYQIKQGAGSWDLKLAGKLVNVEDTIGTHDIHEDGIVVFEAVKKLTALLQPERTATQNPLSPTDGNAPRLSIPPKPFTPSGVDENSTSQSPRTLSNLSPSDQRSAPHQSNQYTAHVQSPAHSTSQLFPSTPGWGFGSLHSQVPSSTSLLNHSNPSSASIGILKPERVEPYASYASRSPSFGASPGANDQSNTSVFSHAPLHKFSRPPTPSHGQALVKSEPIRSQVDEYSERQSKNFQLQNLIKDATPQILESAVEASVELLNELRGPLLAKIDDSPDAEQWLQQIDGLKKQAVKTRTVIGVVGNTGAGKSSVINAMLEEERLVPTNCMRACTACVTEISFNHEEAQLYKADIEFISAGDWEKELKVLFQDLLDGDGKVSRDCTNEDSDAGIAYAKIKAVYPQKTKEDIANSSVALLIREVANTLGSTRNIKEQDSLLFYKKLQSFVDSKEKAVGKKDKDGKKPKRERELWPLIRVVRLYVRSPALSTGAVIVDLPGVHDSNQARAAVAESYMKQCTGMLEALINGLLAVHLLVENLEKLIMHCIGLWIVAPINRAVDDKAAKSLLGESFKRQLKMDGGFSSVTFICSKTDDISLTEAQDSLGLDDELGPLWEELDRLSAKRKGLKKQIEEMKETKAVYDEVGNDTDEQLEKWETLLENLNDGKEVYAPAKQSSNKKRKASRKEKPTKKKRRTYSSGSDDSDFDGEESEDASDVDDDNSPSSPQDTREPLTETEINNKIQELKTTKKDSRRQKRELGDTIATIRKDIASIEDEEGSIESKLSALCISGRNQYSKGAIQQDFAAGIKELDQEIAAEEDEENFNPDNEVRDYEEVAKSLPVFCVSSRSYQKLQGRFRKEPAVPGFSKLDETEIPALQAHCEKLTETGRAANCRSFINKLSQLLNSLTLWASNDGTGANLSADQQAREARYLQKGLDGLETALEKTVKSTRSELRDELTDNIFDKHETAISAASGDSISTTQQWGSPVNRENRSAGGLYWATYKAISRRSGVYTNAQGLHDWNAQLTAPLIRVIAPGWEKVFTRRLQTVLNNFARSAPAALKKFHGEIQTRAQTMGTGIAQLSMLSHQVSVYEQILKDVGNQIKDMIIARQKDINREYVPVIQTLMQSCYDWCVEEHGTGCFARMKAYMNSYVAETRHTMFQQSVDEVKSQLELLLEDAEGLLDDKTDEVFIQMKRDYRSVLGGGDVQQGKELPKAQRQVRREVKQILQNVENRMKRAIGLEVEEAEDSVKDEGEEAQDGQDLTESAHTERGHGPVKEEPSTSRQDSQVSDPEEQASGKSISDVKSEASNDSRREFNSDEEGSAIEDGSDSTSG
ncbi:uncharacterized protein KY384_008231 [Bacidia gigantensis]|uniref:uncharacterized protein n=1 Tax=Bacidia gigantensis TaxID=2732470 RepID=UPI001D05C19E|nr:uncharacterized protein KY384_008231 [Bacidia gigantensis]KAG8526802.1 hypothetical protein KY384_008231 [Bacidia gigantensis]